MGLLQLLPILLALLLLLAVFVSYTIAVSLGHVPALLPFISDSGVLLPERSVFSQLINMAAAVQLLTFYVRFEQVEAVTLKCSLSNQTRLRDPLLTWNRICLYVGLCASFGLSIIGNFQLEGSLNSGRQPHLQQPLESSRPQGDVSNGVQKLHWTGAFLTFIGGIIWMFIQSWLSLGLYKLHKINGKQHYDQLFPLQSMLRAAILRFVLSALCLLALLLGIALALAAAFHTDESGAVTWMDSHHGLGHWRGRFSIAAAFCEWILALIVVAFTLTFIPDFRTLSFVRPTFYFTFALPS